jgi:PIN domain nuclease of toxin-antitoxin system
VFIWAIGASERLRPESLHLLDDPTNDVVISAVSSWEASIKVSSGKLTLPISIDDALARSRFDQLEIRHEHGIAAGGLPLHHRDPFDRMLIAQAQLEGLTIVTRDRRFAAYDVALLPA